MPLHQTFTAVCAATLMIASSAASAVVGPSTAGSINIEDFKASVDAFADRFVQTEVQCSDGQAIKTVRTRQNGGIEQVSFEPILAAESGKSTQVTCSDGEFQLGGKKLTNTEVAAYAVATRIVEADPEDWVLILTPTNQPATYVPHFSSEVACEQAVNIWQGRDREEKDRPGHAVCVGR